MKKVTSKKMHLSLIKVATLSQPGQKVKVTGTSTPCTLLDHTYCGCPPTAIC
ncbi:hypothetical protein [Chitinophaga solisilvae]|uniref:hypothetical protein n=1 Tax=Chitinophaga solisilvae TaxID=1233460 RepID=UPI00136CF900|nr:hypothetical protein [Chitinophaga solisilvae]